MNLEATRENMRLIILKNSKDNLNLTGIEEHYHSLGSLFFRINDDT